jgi:hypothetical protein
MMDGWMIFSRFLLVWAAGPRVDILNSSFLRGPLQFIVLCCSKREFLFPFDFRKMNNTFNPFFLKKNNKLTSVSIITRSYHNQRVDANSLDKNHGKSTTTSSSSSASPGVVPGVTSRGSGALTTPRSELVGRRCRHGRLRRACSIRCPTTTPQRSVSLRPPFF